MVTFCHLTPHLHNDIDTPPPQNTFTPAKKPESDMSTVKIVVLFAFSMMTTILRWRKFLKSLVKFAWRLID